MSEFKDEPAVIKSEAELIFEDDRRSKNSLLAVSDVLNTLLSMKNFPRSKDNVLSVRPPSYGWIQSNMLRTQNVFIASVSLVSD